MATVTGTLTVNAAFLQEIKDDNRDLQELLAALRHLTSNPILFRNHRRNVVQLLAEVRDQLAFHFALEEAYGYFEEAIAVAPRIAEQADELRAEHMVLFESICRIADAAEQWQAEHVLHHSNGEVAEIRSAGAPFLRRIVIQFLQFSDQLLQHEQNEHALILEALDTDIGGEG